MALIKCKECGHEVSTTANACPNCGAPVYRSVTAIWVMLVIMLIVGAGMVVYLNRGGLF
jgi:RNA polymerase subunit RPABC4/transcription elongation factor Spt4